MRGVEAEALEAGAGEHDGVGGALAHLAHAGIHVAPDLDDSQVRPVVQELGPAPQAGRGDDGPVRQAVQGVPLVGNEGVRGVVARGDRREDDALPGAPSARL